MLWYGHGLVHPCRWSAIPQDSRCSLMCVESNPCLCRGCGCVSMCIAARISSVGSAVRLKNKCCYYYQWWLNGLWSRLTKIPRDNDKCWHGICSTPTCPSSILLHLTVQISSEGYFHETWSNLAGITAHQSWRQDHYEYSVRLAPV